MRLELVSENETIQLALHSFITYAAAPDSSLDELRLGCIGWRHSSLKTEAEQLHVTIEHKLQHD